MPNVLSGTYLKYIIDFEHGPDAGAAPAAVPEKRSVSGRIKLPKDSLCRTVIETIEKPPQDLLPQAQAKMDNKTKPLGALGKLEALSVKMSLIQNRLDPIIRQKNLFVFAGDHGITEEGVSAYPSEVTAQMVDNFLNGGAAINVLCRHHGIEMKVVDMGVKKQFASHPDLIDKKVAHGTKNFALEPAMTKTQMIKAVDTADAACKLMCEMASFDEARIANKTISLETSRK